MAQSDAVPALAPQEIGAGKAGPGRGHKTGDNGTRFPRGTNSAAYLIARLKRDAPERWADNTSYVCGYFGAVGAACAA